jgi:protein CpxP
MHSRTTLRAAVFAAALSIAGTALAQTPDAAPSAPPAPPAPGAMPPGAGKLPDHPGMRAPADMKQSLERMHDRLGLDAQQDALWQQAIATMRDNHEKARALHMDTMKQSAPLLKAPQIDADALYALHRQAGEQMRQLHEADAQAWLAVYHALNPQQKQTVSDTIRAHRAPWPGMMPPPPPDMRGMHGHRPHLAPGNASAPADKP